MKRRIADPNNEWLTLKEVMAILGVCRTTLWRLTTSQADPLPTFHRGGVVRVLRDDLIEWIDRHTHGRECPGQVHAE